jgi:fatty acid desaturase
MLATIAVFGVVSYWIGLHVLLMIWLIPLFVVAGPVHALIEMPEHFRCETDNTNVFRNTRSIKSNWFMTWFTNGNNYHVEHHLVPGAPIERLPEIHELVSSEIKYVHATYRDFFLEVMSRGTTPSQFGLGPIQ